MNTKYLDIIKAPVVTEKSTNGKNLNQYTFKVAPKASKIEIKEAVEKIFNVEVVAVSTLNEKVKTKRVGRYEGLSNRSKKEIVTLKAGQTIEIK